MRRVVGSYYSSSLKRVGPGLGGLGGWSFGNKLMSFQTKKRRTKKKEVEGIMRCDRSTV